MSTATYYFDGYDAGEAWGIDPSNMVDGSTSTSAQTDTTATQLCNSNTCTGIDLGKNITVELRLYRCNYSIDFQLRPIFTGGDGDTHDIAGVAGGGNSWSDWIDITNDTNAPVDWLWSDVQNLKCDVVGIQVFLYPQVFKVEIRVTYDENSKDLLIYYDSLSDHDYINCWCSRWDVQNYNVVMETWLKKSDLQTLRENITPQAVGELYTILGRPKYYDSTWSGENTIKLVPISDEQLAKMRGEKLIYVKNISDSPVKGPSGWLNVKIEGMISGTGAL